MSNVDKKSDDDDLPVRLCNYTDVYYNERITGDLDFMVATATRDQCAIFGLRSGDVVLTKDSETADDIGVGALIAEDIPGLVCGYHLAVVRPRESAHGPYLRWVLTSDATRQGMSMAATGVTRFGLRSEAIADLEVPMRPLHEQRAIADYLDREAGRIDALIAAKQRMCSLLEDRYWAWLDLKIQELASDFLPLRRVMRRITDGPFGSSLKSAHYVDAGARVVRLGNIGRGVFKAADEAFISSDYYAQLSRHAVRQGDLLVAGLGDSANPVGRACVAPDLGAAIVKADCYCAAVDPNVADAEFIALWLSSDGGSQRIAVAGRGTTRTRIDLEIAKEIEVPVLPLDEQHQIATEAEQRRKLHEATADAIERQVALLHERRLALISAAISGQIGIPVAA